MIDISRVNSRKSNRSICLHVTTSPFIKRIKLSSRNTNKSIRLYPSASERQLIKKRNKLARPRIDNRVKENACVTRVVSSHFRVDRIKGTVEQERLISLGFAILSTNFASVHRCYYTSSVYRYIPCPRRTNGNFRSTRRRVPIGRIQRQLTR